MSSEPIVFVVDDDAAFSESLCALVNSMGLKSRSFASAVDYIAQFNPEEPGVLLLDVRMPTMSGLTLQEKLESLPICPSVVILTGHAEVSTALRAMRQGAVDFLQKTFTESELYEAIQQGIAQDTKKRAEFKRLQVLQEKFSHLNDAEKEVLKHVLQGVANKRIAAELGVSRRTVEDRRARVMQKLEVDNLAELVKLALAAQFSFQ